MQKRVRLCCETGHMPSSLSTNAASDMVTTEPLLFLWPLQSEARQPLKPKTTQNKVNQNTRSFSRTCGPVRRKWGSRETRQRRRAEPKRGFENSRPKTSKKKKIFPTLLVFFSWIIAKILIFGLMCPLQNYKTSLEREAYWL